MPHCLCPLKQAAKESPQSLGFIDSKIALSFLELDQQTDKMTSQLHIAGIQNESLIAAQCPLSHELISLFLPPGGSAPAFVLSTYDFPHPRRISICSASRPNYLSLHFLYISRKDKLFTLQPSLNLFFFSPRDLPRLLKLPSYLLRASWPMR